MNKEFATRVLEAKRIKSLHAEVLHHSQSNPTLLCCESSFLTKRTGQAFEESSSGLFLGYIAAGKECSSCYRVTQKWLSSMDKKMAL